MPSDLLDLRRPAVIAWATAIVGLSRTPSLDSGRGFCDLVPRKAPHATAYAILGALLARVVPRPPAVALGILYPALRRFAR